MLLFELDNYVSGNVVYNDMLNPKIYGDDGNMRPEVHKALMAVADNFINDIDHPDLVIHDIILTGSSANYNWTKFSDIDLHLISDVDVFADPHMAEKYFNAAKNVWNNNHDVTIRGLDVEVYVEDNDEHNESLGRYSVLNNEWISKPVHNRPVFDEDAVNRKVRYLMREIDAVVDGHPIDIEHIKKKIWDMRKAGLAKGGEFSVENLAFKVLRNMGYLDKIRKALDDAEDEELSIRENEEFKCGWCGSATDAKGNPTGSKGAEGAKKVNGKCCPGGSRDYQSQKSHEDDMRINELKESPMTVMRAQNRDANGNVYTLTYNKPKGLVRLTTDPNVDMHLSTVMPLRRDINGTDEQADYLKNVIVYNDDMEISNNNDLVALLNKETKLKWTPGRSIGEDMKINEIDMPNTPESAIGKVVYTTIGGVNYGGTIKKVKQINGQWYGFAKFLNDSNPDSPGFKVKLDPERFDQVQEGFQDKPTYVKFFKPVAVQAVNMLNQIFDRKKSSNRAFMVDKFAVSIEGDAAGANVDYIDYVLDELDGMYVGDPSEDLEETSGIERNLDKLVPGRTKRLSRPKKQKGIKIPREYKKK
jgi:hypothetical protein